MISSSIFLGLCLSFAVGFSEASSPSFLEPEMSPARMQSDISHPRHLQWIIDYKPGADPDATCKAFQEAAPNYQCACDIQPDKSVALKCLEIEATCNADGSLCFKQNVNIGLTTEQIMKTLETCTSYTTFNNTRFEGSSTKTANYTQITPCVKVVPQTLGDFSDLESCEASINGQACNTCEICTDNAPAMGITLDCCNVNPNGEPLKVECGPMGGGGAFAPMFELYQEADEYQCSGASGVGGIAGMLLSMMGAALFFY